MQLELKPKRLSTQARRCSVALLTLNARHANQRSRTPLGQNRLHSHASGSRRLTRSAQYAAGVWSCRDVVGDPAEVVVAKRTAVTSEATDLVLLRRASVCAQTPLDAVLLVIMLAMIAHNVYMTEAWPAVQSTNFRRSPAAEQTFVTTKVKVTQSPPAYMYYIVSAFT